MLREWIERGEYCEPFRRKYPMAQTMSYIPFRTRRRVNGEWEYTNYGKSRLDFFIISESLYKDCAAHIGMDGIRIEKEPRQETNL